MANIAGLGLGISMMNTNPALGVALIAIYMNSADSEASDLAMAEYSGEADFIRLDSTQVVDAGSLAIAHYDENRLRLYLNGTAETIHIRKGEVKTLFEHLRQRPDFLSLTDDVLCDTDRICLLDISEQESTLYLPNEQINFDLNMAERQAAFDALAKDDAFLCHNLKAVRIGAIMEGKYDDDALVLKLFNGKVRLEMPKEKATEIISKITKNNGFIALRKDQFANLNIVGAVKHDKKSITLEHIHSNAHYKLDNEEIADIFYEVSNRKGFVPLSEKDIINIHGASYIEFSKKYVEITYADDMQKRVKLDAQQMQNFKKSLQAYDKFIALNDDVIVNGNNLQYAEITRKGIKLNYPCNATTLLKCTTAERKNIFAKLTKQDKFFALPQNEDMSEGGVINCRSLLRAEYRESGWFSNERLFLAFVDGSTDVTMSKTLAKKTVAEIINRRPHIINDGRGLINARAIAIASTGRNMLSYHSGADWNWYKNETKDSFKALDNMLALKAVPQPPKNKPPAPKA